MNLFWRGYRLQQGMSLIELMIASSIGLVVVAAVGSLFLSSSQNYRQDERLTFMQQELGYAIAQLIQDMEMSGYWARLHDPSRVQLHGTLSVAADCGAPAAAWVYGDLTALSVVDNGTATSVNAQHACIPEADVHEGSDVIAIKRVLGSARGTDLDSSAMTAGAVYLRTGLLSGLLYKHGGAAFGNIPPPYENYEYRPVVYYIQPYTDSPTESPREPALCRRILRSTGAGTAPAFERECLAQGVENLQVELGIDTDEDGAANYFMSTPTAEFLARAVAVRLYLLARSSRPDFKYENKNTYQIGNMPAPYHRPDSDPVDIHYYHKTLSTEIVLRNPRSLQGLAIQ